MNRRSFLGLIGLAPAAATLAVTDTVAAAVAPPIVIQPNPVLAIDPARPFPEWMWPLLENPEKWANEKAAAILREYHGDDPANDDNALVRLSDAIVNGPPASLARDMRI